MLNHHKVFSPTDKESLGSNMPWRDWGCFERSFTTGLEKAKQKYADWDGCKARLADYKSIGIFPCNSFASDIIEKFAEDFPEHYGKLKVAFDPFPEKAAFRNDILVCSCQDLQKIDLDLLLIAANNFPSITLFRLNTELVGDVPVKIFARLTDEFLGVNPGDLLQSIKVIWNLFDDQESKETYLRVWLARAWCSEKFLNTFSGTSVTCDGQRDADADTICFAGYELEGVNDSETLAELTQEVYRIPGVSPQPGDVVVDAGAYRGDTIAFFEKYIGKTGKVYAFEPDPVNMGFLKKNIVRNNWGNVEVFLCGLSELSGEGHLLDSESGGGFLHVIDSGDTMRQCRSIQLRELDGFVREKDISRIDFLKIDIEGSEMSMLRGAQQSLQTFRPRVALAAYHKLWDLIDLPKMINALGSYRLYLRHHSSGAWGTVLYGVPEEKVTIA